MSCATAISCTPAKPTRPICTSGSGEKDRARSAADHRLPLAGWLRRIVRLLARPADREDLQSQRSLMQEAMSRSPEAFSSDLDLETLMHYYSGGQ